MFENAIFLFDENNLEETVWCLTQEVLRRHELRIGLNDWNTYWRQNQA